jgi:hypothetical protein
VFFRFGETKAGLQLLIGSLVASETFKIAESIHSEYGLDLTQNIFNEHFLITYGLGSQVSKYIFTTDSQTNPQALALTSAGFQISLTWRY